MRVLALSFYCLPLTDVSRMAVHGHWRVFSPSHPCIHVYVCIYTYIHTLTQRADHWRVGRVALLLVCINMVFYPFLPQRGLGELYK